MQDKRVRVVVGTDGAQARDVLSGLVEKQSGVVVGQAQNAPEAIALARNLRPDVVILDCHLPHAFGIKQVPLSRAGGLDAAQFISEEIPNLRVLLVGNLDAAPSLEAFSNPEVAVSLYSDSGGAANMPLVLGNLALANWAHVPIFARILTRKRVTRGRFLRLAEEVTLFGLVGILLGLMMAVTGILLVPGAFAVALGGTAALLGFTTRLVLRRLFKKEVIDESKT